jgi:hypothetical protein
MSAAATVLACGSDQPAGMTAVDGGAETGSQGADPFCRTRPRLSFCEDFDEADLPGRFTRIEGNAALIKREANEEAPSTPNVMTIAHTASATDARLAIDATQGVKYNLFFLMKIEAGHGRVEIAGFDDGDWHLELGVEEDGHWYIEEHAGAGDGGVAPAPRTIATTVMPTVGSFSSVRFDVYVGGNGLGHMRFRSGASIIFEAEPLTFGGGKATLTPHIYVGSRLRGGAPARLSFDTVTLGEE